MHRQTICTVKRSSRRESAGRMLGICQSHWPVSRKKKNFTAKKRSLNRLPDFAPSLLILQWFHSEDGKKRSLNRLPDFAPSLLILQGFHSEDGKKRSLNRLPDFAPWLLILQGF